MQSLTNDEWNAVLGHLLGMPPESPRDKTTRLKENSSQKQQNIANECFSKHEPVLSSTTDSQPRKIAKVVKEETKSIARLFLHYIDIVKQFHGPKYDELRQIDKKFNGLCEIICNYVVVNGLLGKGKSENFLREEITADKLNDESIKKSHIIEVYSVNENPEAFLSGSYPNNIFSDSDQKQLVKKETFSNTVQQTKHLVNREILKKGLDRIEDGEVLKVEIIKKSAEGFGGHATLIKKTSAGKYIYFDSNFGEKRDLDLTQVCDELDTELARSSANDLLLIKGSDYVKVLQEQGILEADGAGDTVDDRPLG